MEYLQQDIYTWIWLGCPIEKLTIEIAADILGIWFKAIGCSLK